MTLRQSLILTATVASTLGAWPTQASADVEVMVLGIRSIEGDDEFAMQLTGALRHAASQVPDWSVAEREIALSQMILAHNCQDVDVSCMTEVAQTLNMRKLLYGTIRRTSADATHGFAITLSLFDAERRAIEGTLTDTVPRLQSDIDHLRDRVRRYVAELTGAARSGTLRVSLNVAGATVRVDDQVVGTAENGDLEVEVDAGRRQVVVAADGYQEFRGSVTVVPGEEASIEVTLLELGVAAPPVSGGGANLPAIISFAAAAGFAGATLYTWLRVLSLDNELEPLIKSTPRGRDVCENDPTARTRDICDEDDLLLKLQYVFIPLTVASAGLGVLFLLLDGDDGEQNAFRLQPSIAADGARLDATLRF